MRWLTTVRSMITSASAKPASRSPPPSDHSWTLFVPLSGWTSDLVAQRRLEVGDDRQRLELDEHVLGGVDHRVAVGADDDGDGVADVLDARPWRRGQCSVALISTPGGTQAIGSAPGVDVLAGEDRHDVLALERRGGVDGDDRGVRLRRADERAPQRAGELDVVDVRRPAGDEPRVLLAAQRAADVAVAGGAVHGGAHAPSPCAAISSTFSAPSSESGGGAAVPRLPAAAASCTARTMLW